MIVAGLRRRARRLRLVAVAATRSEPLCRCSCSATATSRWPTSPSRPSGSSSPSMGFPLMLWAQLVRGDSPDRGRTAAGADGGRVDPARAGRRAPHRPGPPARPRRRPASSPLGVVAAAARPRDGARHPAVAGPGLDGAAGRRQLVPLGAAATTANRNLAPAPGRSRRRGSTTPTARSASVLGVGRDRRADRRRLAANGLTGSASEEARSAAALPAQVGRRVHRRDGAVAAPAAGVLLLGLVAVLFFERPRHFAARPDAREEAPAVVAATAA